MLKSLMSYHAGSRCLVTVTSSSGDHGKIHLMPGRPYHTFGSFASHVYFSGEPPRPCTNMTTPSTSTSLGAISIGGARAGKVRRPADPRGCGGAAAEVFRTMPRRVARGDRRQQERGDEPSHPQLHRGRGGRSLARYTSRAREPGRRGVSRVPRNAARASGGYARPRLLNASMNSVRPVRLSRPTYF